MENQLSSTEPKPPPPSPKDPNQNPTRVDQMKAIHDEALDLFKKKNADYGDAFANYGSIGVLVRMGDKISRLQSITTKQISLVNSEALRDTLIDLHNYSAMAIMLLDEQPTQTQTPTRAQTPTQEQDPTMTCNEMAWSFTKHKTALSSDPSTLPMPPEHWLKN